MEQTEKKTIHHYMRMLHRDLGFLVIGLIVVYAASGILLVHRDTDFLKYDTRIEKKISPDLEPSDLGEALRMRDFRVTKTEGNTIYFRNGSYDRMTGVAVYTAKEIPFPLNKFINLHKSMSGNPAHWPVTLFGLILFFLAVSSFWMYKKGTRLFCRGIFIAGAGILLAILLILI